MKVLMSTDTVGGVWTYAIELARALRSRNVSFLLATMGAPLSATQREQADALDNVEVEESGYRLEWMDDPWEEVERAGEWLLALEARARPDVVHLNGYAHGALPWTAPVCIVAHSCVLSWWAAVKETPAPAEWDRYRDAVRRGVRAADVVIAPSHAMLRSLRAHYGELPPARVIYNGREPTLFTPGLKEPFVLSVGRLWDEAKNTAALESVAGELSWPVYLAGDAQRPGGGRRDFGRVHCLGRLTEPELASWLARAAIYALPARYEPFGLSALEAALAGCALVLGDLPSQREIWGDAALFVPPDDPDALVAAIDHLIDDASLRRDYARAAHARARASS
jgi:glycosyltransferase involved in cell wall biosynthesis